MKLSLFTKSNFQNVLSKKAYSNLSILTQPCVGHQTSTRNMADCDKQLFLWQGYTQLNPPVKQPPCIYKRNRGEIMTPEGTQALSYLETNQSIPFITLIQRLYLSKQYIFRPYRCCHCCVTNTSSGSEEEGYAEKRRLY